MYEEEEQKGLDDANTRDRLVSGDEMDPEEGAFLEGYYEEDEEEEEEEGEDEYEKAFD